MDFLISNAYAQDAASSGGLMGFLPLILIFVVFYFMLIRPQMKRAKDHKNMVAEASKIRNDFICATAEILDDDHRGVCDMG